MAHRNFLPPFSRGGSAVVDLIILPLWSLVKLDTEPPHYAGLLRLTLRLAAEAVLRRAAFFKMALNTTVTAPTAVKSDKLPFLKPCGALLVQ